MVTFDEFSRIAARIHGAVLAPQDWPSVMVDIRLLFDGGTAGLVVSDGASRAPRCTCMADDARTAYQDYYHPIDYVLADVEAGPVGLMVPGSGLIARAAGSEFDVDWMRPHRFTRGFFVRLTAGRDNVTFLVAGDGSRFETAARAAVFAALIPHVQQALHIEQRLHGRVLNAEDAERAADSIQRGLVLLDRGGAVIHANAAAEAILEHSDGLSRRGGRLRIEETSGRTRLQAAISAAATPGGSTDPAAQWVLCNRPSGKRPYLLHVLPAADGAVLTVVVDLDLPVKPPADVLRRIYGLTRAESDVAVRILGGKGLAPIAEELSVSLTTVRTHLQRIFDKTGTHRQAELVRLLLTLSG